jgi:copper transport protein
MKRLCLLALFLLVFSLTWTRVIPVQAHAMLMRSIPDANASLASSPAQIELFFSEAVTPKLSKISVMDSSGKLVNNGDARVDAADATHLVVSVSSLNDGVYMVVWEVISASDGHQTNGSFPFAVGKVDASALAMASSQMAAPPSTTPLGDMIIKGFLYLSVATSLGGILFTFLVWNPSLKKAQIPAEDVRAYGKFSHKLVIGTLAVLVVADVLALMVQAGHASRVLLGWPWQPEFMALLGSRVGLLGVLRFGLAFVLAGLYLPRQNGWNRWAGLGINLLLLLTLSMESHAAGDPNPVLPVAADWIHLVGVSVWVGGLFSFLGGMRLIGKLNPEPRTRMTSYLIPHFTTLALASVGVLILTGIYASILRVGTLASLFNSPYGLALVVKLGIAAPMLALGGINFLFTSPSMRRAAARPGGSPALVKRFYGLLTGEATLGIVILLWVGIFTTLPPAKIAAMPAGFDQKTQADDLTIQLTIDPGQPGINTFTATITSGGKPVTNAQQVSLEFKSLTGMVPASKADLTSQGNGIFKLQGGYLAMTDKWDMKAVVIRPGKFDAYADFVFDMNQKMGQTMP